MSKRDKQIKEAIDRALQGRKDYLDVLGDISDKEKEILDFIIQQEKKARSQKDYLVEAFLNAEDRLKIEEELLKIGTDQNDLLSAKQGVLQAELDIEKQKLETAESGSKEQEKILEIISEIQGEQEDLNKAQQRYNDQIQSGQNLVVSIGNALGLAASEQQTMVGSMTNMVAGLSSNLEMRKKIKEQISQTFSPLNILASLSSKILESTIALLVAYDGAVATFNAAAGAAGEYNDAIAEAGQRNLALGVGVTEASQAMAGLFSNMSSFTSLSKAEQTNLAGTTAALEKVGVASTTTAQNLDKLTRFLGMSAEQAMEQQKELAVFAAGIGVAPAQMAEDFAKAGPLLVKYGQAAESVFKELSIAAKETGIQMDALLGITGQFDTFEGAANAAGKLNAILGGNLLNSVELLTATDAERVEMLRQSVIESGRSFDQLGRFEKQAIMAAAGISDLETAQRLFGDGSTEAAEQQKEFNEMVQKSQTVVQKLEKLVMSLAITLEPFVDWVSEAVSSITEFVSANRELVQIGTGLLTLMFAVIKVQKINNALTTVSTLKKIADSAAVTANTNQTIANNIAKGESIPINQALNSSMGAGGVAGLGFAKSMFVVGAAVALLAVGMIGLAFAFKLFVDQLDKPGIQNLPMVTISMLGLAGAVAILAGSLNLMTFGVAGVAVMGLALGTLAASLALIKTEELMALAEVMTGLSGMTVEKSVSFKASMEGLSDVLDKITTAEVKVAAKETLIPILKAFPQANVAAPAPAAATGQQKAAPTTVILKLNERELAKAVVDVFRKEMNLSLG